MLAGGSCDITLDKEEFRLKAEAEKMEAQALKIKAKAERLDKEAKARLQAAAKESARLEAERQTKRAALDAERYLASIE